MRTSKDDFWDHKSFAADSFFLNPLPFSCVRCSDCDLDKDHPGQRTDSPVNFANFTHPWPTRWDQIRRMRSGNGWRIVLGRPCAYKRVGIAFRIPMGIPLAIST